MGYNACVRRSAFAVNSHNPNLRILCLVLRAYHCNTLTLFSIARFTSFQFDTVLLYHCVRETSLYYDFIFVRFEFILISIHFSMIHFTLAIHSIHDITWRSNIITLKSNLNYIFVVLHVSALRDIDLRPHIMILIRARFILCFTSFNSIILNVCRKYAAYAPIACIFVLLCIDLVLIDYLHCYPHSTKCIPHPGLYWLLNFIAFLLIVWLS